MLILLKRYNMPKRETLKTIMELIGTWLIVFFGSAAVPTFFPTITVVISIITAIGLFIYGIVYFHQKPEPEQVEPQTPSISKKTSNSSAILKVTPIEHIKGKGNDVEPSQVIYGTFGSHVDGTQKEYIVKFGVLRVKALKGHIHNCCATAKIKITHELGKYNPHKWEDVGTLNWFSIKKKEQFDGKFDRLADLKDYGLNKFLKNEKVDLLESNEQNLLIMYMIKDNAKVFVCNNGDARVIGWVEPDKFLEFILEVKLSAQNNLLTTCRYIVRVLWDDYKFSTESGSRASTKGITG